VDGVAVGEEAERLPADADDEPAGGSELVERRSSNELARLGYGHVSSFTMSGQA
jgi:hypothetical protein